MTEKLLPCPFCGAKAHLLTGMFEFVDVEITCTACSATGGNENNGETEAENRAVAIAAWNRRTPAPEGEVVAWGCFDANGLDDKLVFRDQRRAEDAAFAFTPSMTVKALYASPVVPVSREEIARIIRDHIEGDEEGYLSGVGAAADAILAALGAKGADHD